MPDPVATMPDQNYSYAPYGLLDSIYKYVTFPYEQQLAYAQLQAQAQQNAADIASRGAAANASAYGSYVGALGGIGQQTIASKASLQAQQAQLQNDIVLAAGGDRNAALRLQAQLAQAAQIQNQQARLQVANLAAGTGLREGWAARNFVRGVGGQPAFGSAMLAGPLQDITAPNVGYANYGPAATVNMNLPSVSLPGAPTFNTGGAGSFKYTAPTMPDFSGLLSNVFQNMNPTPAGSVINPNPTGANPNAQPQTVGSPLADANVANWQAQNPGAPTPWWINEYNAGKLRGMAGGGNLAPGQAAMVGERGPEILSLRPDGSIEVLPLTRGYADGGTITPTTTASPWQDWRQRARQRMQTATTPPTSLAPVSSSTNPVDAGGGTSPEVTVKPDGSIKVGASSNPAPPQYDFPTSPTQTGQELLNLPATQALKGNAPGGYNASQTFSLPEYGLYDLPGIAQSAALFRPGILNPQEQSDLMQLFAVGYNVPPEVIQSILDAYRPGFRTSYNPVGY